MRCGVECWEGVWWSGLFLGEGVECVIWEGGCRVLGRGKHYLIGTKLCSHPTIAGYSEDDIIMRWFWEVVEAYSNELKLRLLQVSHTYCHNYSM